MKSAGNCVWLGVISTMSASLLNAAVITQDFDTGPVLPGAGGTSADFNVNQFDTSLGTLTRVTFSMALQTWDGYYTVENATSESVPVSGTIYVGIEAYLQGAAAPSALADHLTPLFSGQSKTYYLEDTGDTDSLYGPASDNPVSAGPRTENALSANFYLYEGMGTYTVSFLSEEGSRHEADGAVNGTFGAAAARGLLTVTYEYTPVPEPTALGLLAIGVAVLTVRRRRWHREA